MIAGFKMDLSKIDPKSFRFTDSPLMDYIHRAMINGNDCLDLSEALLKKFNLTKLLLDDIKARMLRKKNYIFSMWGFTGIGKTTVATQLANYTHGFVLSDHCKHIVDKIEEEFGRKPRFDLTNICFDSSELVSRLRESVPMETFVYDEAKSEKTVGTGSMREKMDKERIMKRVRALQQNFILCDPLIDESKLSELHLYKIQSFDIEYNHMLNRSIIHARNSDNNYSPFGHIITKFFEMPGYEKKKMDHLIALEKLEFGGGRIKLWDDLANEMIAKGIGNFKFQDYPYLIEEWTKQNYTKDEVKNIIKKIRFKVARPKTDKSKIGDV